MGKRIDLQNELKSILGSNNVYFQPPESVKMQYDAIVYHLQRGETKFAGNNPYQFTRCYNIILISKNPDCPIVDKLATAFPMITLDRCYVVDNLNHWAYTLFF